MFTKNCVVRCVACVNNERNFTPGKEYRVENNTIMCDDGFSYNVGGSIPNIINWLKPWYTFELVENFEKMICSICGETITDEDFIEIDGKYVCNSCTEERVFFCDCCGQAVLDENSHYINDETLCEFCFDRYYRECVCCGEYHPRNDMFGTNDGFVCDDCFDIYYHCCNDCGEHIHEDVAYWDEDSEEWYCADCFNAHRRRRVIKNYHFKPIPMFYGASPYRGELFMGVELEVDEGGEDSDNAREILNIGNSDSEHIYIKHDGSLEEGFEIVSHPATLAYHLNNIEWAEIMRKAVRMGYRSHDTDTCGLHVHVSRDALGNTMEEQEETISRILYFIEKNWHQIIRFTRRTEANLDRWASRYGIECDCKSTYKKAKDDWNRYRCLNLLNDNTIEFRMFRGTLNYTTFCATLQLVYNICTMCKCVPTEEVEKMEWCEFIRGICSEQYPELFEYIKIRGLNV